MQRGSIEIFLGLFLIFSGVVAIKMTDLNWCWALIAAGAFLGCKGGIAVSRLTGE